MADSAKDLLMGQVNGGRGHLKYMIRVLKEPAKFNAILLTWVMFGGFMCLISSALELAVLTNWV